MLPNDVSTRTRLTREIELAIPVVSAAMDTVTEARLAIALARVGGIGIVHRNLSIEDQVAEVDKVKRSEAGMIVEPVTLHPGEPVAQALALMAHYRISGVPITDADGVLVGILTNRDLRFETDTAQPVSALMTEHEPRHRAGRDDPRRGGADPPPEQGREAPGRRCRRPPPGADHGQGHLQAARVPGRDEGSSRGVCGSGLRSASARTRSSARRRSPPRAPTCSCSTRRTATPAASSTWHGSCRDSTIQLVAGNIATAEARRRPDRCRRGRRQGRDRARQLVHDTGRGRRGRAAGHRGLRVRRRLRGRTASR